MDNIKIEEPCRYSVIKEKNMREIVMLRGNGCAWKRCRFCDYHLDSSKDEIENYHLNSSVLSKVTGKYGVDTRYITRGGDRVGIYFLEKGASQRPSKVIYDRKENPEKDL